MKPVSIIKKKEIVFFLIFSLFSACSEEGPTGPPSNGDNNGDQDTDTLLVYGIDKVAVEGNVWFQVSGDSILSGADLGLYAYQGVPSEGTIEINGVELDHVVDNLFTATQSVPYQEKVHIWSEVGSDTFTAEMDVPEQITSSTFGDSAVAYLSRDDSLIIEWQGELTDSVTLKIYGAFSYLLPDTGALILHGYFFSSPDTYRVTLKRRYIYPYRAEFDIFTHPDSILVLSTTLTEPLGELIIR